MDNPEMSMTKLDTEFDQLLADMKPPVLRLPHKSDRQRCALWIKKFCDPPASGIHGRKNRNMYAQLLLHMLRRGHLEGPFTEKPEPGPLPTLPAYMSIYFDDMKGTGFKQDNQVPDWVNGELGSDILSIGSSGLEPRLTSTQRPRTAPDKYSAKPHHSSTPQSVLDWLPRPYSTMGARPRDRSPSPPRARSHDTRVPPLPRDPGREGRTNWLSDTEDHTDPFKSHKADLNWNKDIGHSTFATTAPGNSTTFDPSTFRSQDKETDMRTKLVEAKFQEEKLKLQQKHDSNVQKILDRKNTELEDLKVHYRTKLKEQEQTIDKLDKQVQALSKELQTVQAQRDQQVQELKRLAEEETNSQQAHFDRKLHDVMADFEQDKFEMEKKHTTSIQELLDDTNERLQKMEEEYKQQTAATSAVIEELENRIHQVTEEAETAAAAKNQLEHEKFEVETRADQLSMEFADLQARYGSLESNLQRIRADQDQEIQKLRNKHEANLEFMKQENNMSSIKAADTISDLEQHVAQLKQSLEKSETQRLQKVRELEQMQQQDKLHLEHLHDKKMRGLQKEMDTLEQDLQRKLRATDNALRDKEAEMKRLKETHQQQLEQSQQALQEFKVQVERNSNKMYEEMKQQMEKISADLDRSKELREKQALEFHKQIETEKIRHDKELKEMKFSYEQDKSRMLQEFHTQKEVLHTDKEQELDSVRDLLKSEMRDIETRARDRQDRDTKTICELEKQVCSLREEVVQANQLRKQQLVELGLLREEEKQKMAREREIEVTKLKSEMDQQRLELEKKHSYEMEQTLDKTNTKLKEIEKEYSQRSNKATESIEELQNTIQQLKEEASRQHEYHDQQMADVSSRFEEERRKLKHQHAHTTMTLQQETEGQKSKVRALERKFGQQQQEYEEKFNQMRRGYEDRMQGLMPATVRQELEDTIGSLKSQVSSLQQRAQVLQEELEVRNKYSSVTPLSASLASSTPIPTT